MQAFPSDEAHAVAEDAAWTLRCVPGLAGCFRRPEELRALAPDRIVFGGGMYGIPDAFRHWMPHLAEALDRGAEVHLHNLGVARLKFDLGWLDAAARSVFARATSFTVRDYVSFEMIAEAGIPRMPRISFYPEADVAPDPALADALLPQGRRLLGLSIIPLPGMQACLRHDAARVRALLDEFHDHLVVPIASTVHRELDHEDDIAGIRGFLDDVLPRAEIAAPVLLDRAHWRAQVTPQGLKGLIARCDALVTQRKHNAVHAIGAGVRVIGLHPQEDDSLRRTFIALSHRLKPGSRCVGLDAPPREPAA
jgi:hypothetical protein